MGMPITRINTADEAAVREALATIPEQKGKRFQFQHRLADGTLREVEVSSSRIQFDGRSLLHSIVFDVTARRKAEANWKPASSTRWLSAAVTAESGTWNIRSNTHFRSQRWTEMLGYGEGEFPETATAFEDRIHPEDRDRVLGELDHYLKGEIPVYCIEYRIRHKNGGYLWVMARAPLCGTSRAWPIAWPGLIVTSRAGNEPRRASRTISATWRRRAPSRKKRSGAAGGQGLPRWPTAPRASFSPT